MKPDITSAHRILSRKIRVKFKAIFSTVLLGLVLIQPCYLWAEKSHLITPKSLIHTSQNELVIIDTRSKFKYLLGHIPNAIHIGSWEDFTQKINGVRGLLIEDRNFIVSKLKPYGINPNTTIIVYCAPKDPWRTDGRFFWMFERFGFKKVAILKGGLDNWLNSGGELERGRAKPRGNSSLTIDDIILNHNISADQKWIVNRLGSKDIAIIDNRTREEYDGHQPYGSARGGHIPTAVNIHWPDFFSPEGFIRDAKEISLILNQHEINIEKEIIVYCTGGVRSSMAYFVLRYLGYKVRNYDGSWWDWSFNQNLPIETT